MSRKAQAEENEPFRSEVLDAFIECWFEAGHERAQRFPERRVPVELLDELFRRTLKNLNLGWGL